MRSTTERRQAILLCLCERRYETMENLMFEFQVSRSTIRRDIQVLSVCFPLITSKGTGGGVRVMDGYKLGKTYLSDKQVSLLEKLALTLEGEDLLTINQILLTFRKPIPN